MSGKYYDTHGITKCVHRSNGNIRGAHTPIAYPLQCVKQNVKQKHDINKRNKKQKREKNNEKKEKKRPKSLDEMCLMFMEDLIVFWVIIPTRYRLV